MAEQCRQIQSPKDALRTLAACPNCGKVSQLRNLSYKHKCKVPANLDTIRKKHALKLQALQDRAMKRLKNPALEEDLCGPCVEESPVEGGNSGLKSTHGTAYMNTGEYNGD